MQADSADDPLAHYLGTTVSPLAAFQAQASRPPGTPTEREALGAMLRLAGAMSDAFPTGGVPPLGESEQGRRLLELPPAEKARVAIRAYTQWSLDTAWTSPLERVITDLFRTKFDLDPEQALELAASSHRLGQTLRYRRIASVTGALKRHVETRGLAPELSAALVRVRDAMRRRNLDSHLDGRKIIKSLDEILALGAPASDAPAFEPKSDSWGAKLTHKLAELSAGDRAQLTPLLQLASKGGENAKPTKAWLKEARRTLQSTDAQRAGALILDVVALYDCERKSARPRAETELSLENQSTLRALLWLAAMAAPASACRRLENFARTYLTWVLFDYNSLVLGNASIHAFSLMPAGEGVAGLLRLRRHLKRPGEVKAIDKALTALAEESGMTADDLEEIALPDLGFDLDGKRALQLDSGTAELALSTASQVEIVNDGSASAADLKAFVDETTDTLKAIRLRLERLYLSERSLTLADWRERYLRHPLVSTFARRLIWSFEREGSRQTALPLGDRLCDAGGVPLELGDEVRVTLWHPMHSDVDTVLAWRRRLLELNVTQPFKQAHREIYVLTDVERETATYSNRFAGQILAQKVFRALSQERGWKAPLQGKWSSGRAPILKELPAQGMRFELRIEPLEASAGERWQFDLISTNQVRFVRFLGRVAQSVPLRDGTALDFEGPASAPVPLADVAPVIFSEMMRDVDLFVGVAGIGNDPLWAERRGHQFADYWLGAASGTLTESGRTRRTLLEELLPSLSIASRCRLEERYLVVEGALRTYRIHLGSANIQMEPDNRFLCIVPDKARLTNHVYLPFEGDATLSVILSKAFMLAADDKIKDRSIRAQIDAKPR